jgi:hypothetical protein
MFLFPSGGGDITRDGHPAFDSVWAGGPGNSLPGLRSNKRSNCATGLKTAMQQTLIIWIIIKEQQYGYA